MTAHSFTRLRAFMVYYIHMKFLSRIIFSLFSNLLAFIVAEKFITGFLVSGDLKELLIVVAIFTAINTLIRPILKLILTPFIILTMGLGLLIVNALMLYLLDYFSENVTIQGLEPLAYATLIISAVNVIITVTARKTYAD
ncbi:MAG: hypothetical protein UT41_C0001G0096 [Candidatus Wolfebacteria bacterium GW2011_GWC2_39_22]|uniref:Phage holin family protein n=2 Tax=Candidatus Wolfeibacteriota TaxID=1752735 RepID=A0A0G1HAD2_9BACT|nr:MAG: hypothetical protein UT41_C0001G0096 [Candidatus Wolfebacteria bacterium GW2011_GWC2_39_22]KKT43508.1 MAG: hypothetical protein UW32_C0001G0100 [Candidatus Wolfebacteria bacterium GW2011_GWE2_44_13]HBI25753.1 hypothetical protein [Candidatus Wolfebacteria bacterium]